MLNFRNLHFSLVIYSGLTSAGIARVRDYHTNDPRNMGILAIYQHRVNNQV